MQFAVELGFYGISTQEHQPATRDMRAEYTLIRDDYAAYFKYMQRRMGKLVDLGLGSKVLIWCFIVLLVLSGLNFGISENLFGLSDQWKYGVSCALFIASICGITAIYYITYARKMIRAIVSDDSPLLGDFKIEVLDNGMMMRNAHFEAKYAWSMFRYIVEDSDHIYLLHDNGVGQTIPKRSFKSEREVRDFLAAIDAKLPYSQTSG